MLSSLENIRSSIFRVSVGVPRKTRPTSTDRGRGGGLEYLSFTFGFENLPYTISAKEHADQQLLTFNDLSLLSVFPLDTPSVFTHHPNCITSKTNKVCVITHPPLLTYSVRMKQQLAPVLGRLVLFQLRTSFANTRCSVLIYNYLPHFTIPIRAPEHWLTVIKYRSWAQHRWICQVHQVKMVLHNPNTAMVVLLASWIWVWFSILQILIHSMIKVFADPSPWIFLVDFYGNF